MQNTFTWYTTKKEYGSLNTDERATWSEFLKGNNTALAVLYKLHAGKLYNYGRQFADKAIVLDCIQDLFYDLIKNREKLSPCNSVKAYLLASLRRKIFRNIKKLEKEVAQSLTKEDGFRVDLLQSDNGDLDGNTSERIKMIEEMCNSLPVRQREIIILYYFEELSYEEIMNIMDIPKVSSARILVHRALQSLRGTYSKMAKDAWR